MKVLKICLIAVIALAASILLLKFGYDNGVETRDNKYRLDCSMYSKQVRKIVDEEWKLFEERLQVKLKEIDSNEIFHPGDGFTKAITKLEMDTVYTVRDAKPTINNSKLSKYSRTIDEAVYNNCLWTMGSGLK